MLDVGRLGPAGAVKINFSTLSRNLIANSVARCPPNECPPIIGLSICSFYKNASKKLVKKSMSYSTVAGLSLSPKPIISGIIILKYLDSI